MDIGKLREIMLSGGDPRYDDFELPILLTALKQFILICEEREFPQLPALSNDELEYLRNIFRMCRPTHDPEIAEEVIRVIWNYRRDLLICKSWDELRLRGDSSILYYVVIEPKYIAGRADVGLVYEKCRQPEVIIPVEIGDTRVNKPIEALQDPVTEELWVVPYQVLSTDELLYYERNGYPPQKYYVFKRGVNWEEGLNKL